MSVGLGLMVAGLSIAFVGFIFFRQVGIPLFFFGPIWRASRYVKPPGVALWIGGLVVGGVGILVRFFLHA